MYLLSCWNPAIFFVTVMNVFILCGWFAESLYDNVSVCVNFVYLFVVVMS